jgi:hypothetical protein
MCDKMLAKVKDVCKPTAAFCTTMYQWLPVTGRTVGLRTTVFLPQMLYQARPPEELLTTQVTLARLCCTTPFLRNFCFVGNSTA